MEHLVELYRGKEARVSTFNIFNGFGYKDHAGFKKVINTNKAVFERQGFLALESVKPTKGTKGGRPEESYFLNEQQFTLLVMLVKNNPNSIVLKERIVDEFFRMRSQIAKMSATKSSAEWQNIRKDGKAVYLQKTDIIKKFIDYATTQGSKSALMYYINLAKMENKALFLIEQKYPNVREVLNIKQLGQVMVADQVVEKALEDGMGANLNYKEIYSLAKDRVIQFPKYLGKALL